MARGCHMAAAGSLIGIRAAAHRPGGCRMCGIEPFRSWSGRWPFLGVFLLEVHCGGVRREGIFSCSVAAVVLRNKLRKYLLAVVQQTIVSSLSDFGRRMGDADKDLDEQIREVEKQIRSVGEEIRIVKQEIERVQERIETCSNLQEKAQLRDEKAQLRDNEAQLRREKGQLRDKEAQLREQIQQGRDKCTEFEWLRQDMPSWDSGSCSKTPSTTQKERMYTPVRVEYWNVVKDIEEYLNKADKLKRIYQKVDNLTVTRGKRNLEDVAGSVVASTCDFVSKKLPGSLVIYVREASLEVPPEPVAEGGNSKNPDGSKAEDREVQKCLFYSKPPRVDMLVQSNGKDVAVFELKNGGLGCPVPIYKLWARCSCRTEFSVVKPADMEATFFQGSTSTAGAILTSRKDMPGVFLIASFRAEVGYGVLTDIQNWYLFKRDHTCCLYISVGFKWDDRQPPLPAAIAYLVNSAVDTRAGRLPLAPVPVAALTMMKMRTIPTNRMSTKSVIAKRLQLGNLSSQLPKHWHISCGYIEENKRWNDGKCMYRTRGACSNMRQKQLQEIPASDLHLDDRPITSVGWSGCVVGGILNGRRVAVKFAPRKSERAEFATPYRLVILFCICRLLAVLVQALLNEVDAYLKLKEHWMVFVPPLVGYGTTADGRIVFIATELIDGSPLGPGTVTEEVATAALQALGAVHACGLLHGDVEARNIMVVRGGQPSVRLVDFGFAQCSGSRDSQKAELRKLQRLLQDMMGVGVGKESGGRYCDGQNEKSRTYICSLDHGKTPSMSTTRCIHSHTTRQCIFLSTVPWNVLSTCLQLAISALRVLRDLNVVLANWYRCSLHEIFGSWKLRLANLELLYTRSRGQFMAKIHSFHWLRSWSFPQALHAMSQGHSLKLKMK
uniref:Predicted protein n=1 Tax=Physcomitrium patens TaxID=3218 RepID=A9U1C1_PHYPA